MLLETLNRREKVVHQRRHHKHPALSQSPKQEPLPKL
jgi:hypothetical protein